MLGSDLGVFSGCQCFDLHSDFFLGIFLLLERLLGVSRSSFSRRGVVLWIVCF